MRQHSRNSLRIESRTIVDKLQSESGSRHCQQRQGITSRRSITAIAPDLEVTGFRTRVYGQILKHEDGLKQRSATRNLSPTLNVEQRTVLILLKRKLLFLQALQPAQNFCIGTQLYSERERVYEQPDHRLDTGECRRPAGNS